jgi:hypothetical protein
MPYSPDTGRLYVRGAIRASSFGRVVSRYLHSQRYTGGTRAALMAHRSPEPPRRSTVTGFGADVPAMVYKVDCDGYIVIATGLDSVQGSAAGAAVRVFSLKGQSGPLWPPPPLATVAGPTGASQKG